MHVVAAFQICLLCLRTEGLPCAGEGRLISSARFANLSGKRNR